MTPAQPVESRRGAAGLPFVSVVVPVRDNAKGLALCLEALLRNDYAGGFDLTVADNGSTDGSADVALAHGARVVSCPGLKVSAVRNAGGRATRGDVLAFVDADQRVGPDWISRALETLMVHPASLVGAPPFPPENPTWVQRIYDGLRPRDADVTPVLWLGAGGIALRRETLEQLGGFDEELETCEDVDLCRRVRESGGKVLSDPKLFVIHDGDPATLGKLFRGELWRGRDNLKVSFRERLRLRDVPSIVFPVANLLALASLPLWALKGLAGFGWWGFWAAASVLPATTMLRAPVLYLRLRRRRWGDALRIVPVAAAYEFARALALYFRGSHSLRRK